MTYQVKLERFSGSLDLLLSLMEEREFDISEISLTQVTDQLDLSSLEELPDYGSDSSLNQPS